MNFDDAEIAPEAPKDWNYTSQNIRQAFSLVLRGDEVRAQQLVGDADAAVAMMRGANGGRKATVHDFADEPRWLRSADYLALEFALSLQS